MRIERSAPKMQALWWLYRNRGYTAPIPMTDPSDVTRLLLSSREGQGGALEELLPLVYDELHRLAQRRLSRERRDHTLQATALVNEAYLRLIDQRDQSWKNRSHFLGIAATMMRRILINHAQAHRAEKRGGDRQRVTLHESAALLEGRAADLIDLDAALDRLTARDQEAARLVELRFFAGLSNEEVAELQGVSTRTVERSWRVAKAWLRKELGDGQPDDPPV
ncbi:MAG: RNA polymerase sigma-70 factor (ECF subfamily) [Pseudohongiellaceae bacterium]|jgi:RNA polymerase sigma-70 factor (ECF subfamily)